MIYYLAQKYSGTAEEEEERYQLALKMRVKLELELGLIVYAPISDSHGFWQYIKNNGLPHPPHEFWLKRDLAICEALLCPQYTYDSEMDDWIRGFDANLTMVFINGWQGSKGAEIEYMWAEDNYVRHLSVDMLIKEVEI